ncbi:NAD(P)H-binding protein [Bradyrhizobium sp. U87765 SZCCT0131]|uniref:NAD(P)H-binding protein n=1 Tax=unclassified Bradyrhizobium TaxID=2631580 RepID=UPI001BA5D65B|nr:MULTISPECIES: NAD(P)H-binding protein [unclassified Bradyrhizobium]MBR1217330.1 NAD(P)H-binding protein [Bradyrhizobium sp. U87765 SZCCT0131]MBR1265073.1 NAD(P)H-binding protein [Bradyrhizobium sp. U87765 SZCCT0134]MBR1305055.1 NAD(P)H-binding protein [Bradyrhizobium sp. U87765 SZCCT0110]MBR1320841.1 NAD(P)H-binding protein [Bradyrhizobium sp. U87765 SZCCT0109]MBR1349261.1 NAD(P)H-binding protein [Bradyrhizobium sp. U87765 SZCCT0048]
MAKHSGTSTLVLGATGKTGRRIVARLQAAGHGVRAGSRAYDPPFDWEDRDTWRPALAGINAVYVSYQPDLAMPGALETVQAFFAEALAADVRRLVLLSGRGEPEAVMAEDALRGVSCEWTILRASWFCQNFSESFLCEPIVDGEVVLPAGLAAEPFVDVEDIAEIAVDALTGAGHVGRLYDITGPRALTFADAVGEIAGVTGRDIRFATVAPDVYRAALAQVPLPPGYADLIMYLFTTVLDGRNVPLGDGVMQALGRPPRDFSDYVRRTATTGVWGGRHA